MIVRLEQFALKPGAEERGLPAIHEHAAFIGKAAGCLRAYVATPIHGTTVLVYSEWDGEADLDRMEAALRMNPAASGAFFDLLPLLQSPPHLSRFQVVG